MKYEIPQNRLDKIIFKYLDNTLKSLEKRKAKNFTGIVFAYPDEEFGILGLVNDGNLLIYWKITEDIKNFFNLEKIDAEELIGRWASDRLQLEVKNTSFSRQLSFI